MLNHFPHTRVDIGAGIQLAVNHAGAGPAVLLLHGYPQTHLIWRHLAPAWATEFTVVAPDLKGYGASDAPPPAPDAGNYSKRALAADCVAMMRALGHERFAVVGHDRGGRVAYRLALDHPTVVTHLVTLDIVPTGAMWAASSKRSSINGFHWGLLAQGDGFPERLISADPDYFLRSMIKKWAVDFDRIGEDALAAYCQAFRRPEVIAATCADYRAGATLDDEHDRADLAAGRKISAPLLAIWSDRFANARQSSSDPLAIWRDYAIDVSGFSVPCGHFIPEEAPNAVLKPIKAFLGDSRA